MTTEISRFWLIGISFTILISSISLAQDIQPLRLGEFYEGESNESNYLERFDNLSEGLPTGWHVTFEAKPSQLGVAPDSRRTKWIPNADSDPMKNTAWSGLDQVFRNLAGRNLLLSSGVNATEIEQSEYADRAIGVRTGNSLGESYLPNELYDSGGAAFVLRVDSTSFRVTAIEFEMMLFGNLEIDGSGYYLEWELQATDLSLNGSWVTLTAIPSFYPDAVVGDYKTIKYSLRDKEIYDRLISLGIDLDDNAGIWLRVVATSKRSSLGGSSASARHTYAIDNFKVSFTDLSDIDFDEETDSFSAKYKLSGGTHYHQDFSILDEGKLPSGWHLTRTANFDTMGILLGLDDEEIRNGTLSNNLAYRVAWTNSNGTFKNFANPATSRKGTWLNDQAQEAFPNRMLGFRANAVTGDEGHAFVFNCETTGYKNIILSVDVFSTNASERPLNVSIQYSIDNGHEWKTLHELIGLGKVPTPQGARFKVRHPVVIRLPHEAEDIENLYIRIAALKLTEGGDPGSDTTRTSIGIDDFQLSYELVDDETGVNRLFAYALGYDVAQSFHLQNAIQFSINNEGMQIFEFVRARSSDDIEYIIEGSDNLKDWFDLLVNPGEPGTKVRVIEPLLNSYRFQRLKIRPVL